MPRHGPHLPAGFLALAAVLTLPEAAGGGPGPPLRAVAVEDDNSRGLSSEARLRLWSPASGLPALQDETMPLSLSAELVK
jgi:hypothetical protein